jgi:hypothetical protein
MRFTGLTAIAVITIFGAKKHRLDPQKRIRSLFEVFSSVFFVCFFLEIV